MTIKGNKLKKIGLVLAVVFGLALMSTGERVYAEASISISNSANLISFGDVKPGTSGSVATASDELTITTECSAGSNVYISATNGSDTGTNLVNHGASSNNTISALTGTTIGTTAKALENNTWGFNTDNSATSSGANNGNGVYYGLPTYEDATSKAIYAGTNTTVPIYYGAKVTNTLTPGKYVGSVLYTAVVNKTCNEYTLKFNTNSATASTLVDQTHTVDEQINLADISSTSVISRTGYHLTGWKDQDNNDYGITGTADVNPNDTTPVTLTAQWAPNTYTIEYNANAPSGKTASGSTSSTTGAAYGSTVSLRTNGYTVDGYSFLGWAYSSSATTKDFDSGQTNVSVSTLASNNASGSVVNTNNATITLYAVWKQSYDTSTMQGWAQSGGCTNLAANTQISLKDSRDQKSYTVKKLPDGKCWMTQNLTLNGVELTSDDTNFTSGGPYYIPKDGGAGSLTDSSTKNATTGYNFASGSDNQAMFKFRSKGSYTNDSDTGYYNFYTATLGFSYYNDGKTSGSSTQDICPKGWRLPWTSDAGTTRTTTADFYVLANSYNTNASWTNKPTGSSTSNPYTSDGTIKTGMYTGTAANGNNYAGFSYSGNYYGTSPDGVGSNGRYWSSSVYNTNDGYYLVFNSSNVYPQNNYLKYYGFAVRCVAK